MSFEVVSLARGLWELMMCHDRALQQIYLLDIKIEEITKRQTLLAGDVVSPGSLHDRLEQRINMYEWIRDCYEEYQIRKWACIQSFIDNVFGGLVPRMVNEILILALICPWSMHGIRSFPHPPSESSDEDEEELDSDDYMEPLDSDDDDFEFNPRICD